jgi:hypothetical protein
VTDIFPAEDQPIGEVITELTQLGLVEGQDFKLHFTWDMRPFVQTEPAAYEKWQKKHGADGESEKDGSPEATRSPEKNSEKSGDGKDSSEHDDSKGSTARKRGGK